MSCGSDTTSHHHPPCTPVCRVRPDCPSEHSLLVDVGYARDAPVAVKRYLNTVPGCPMPLACQPVQDSSDCAAPSFFWAEVPPNRDLDGLRSILWRHRDVDHVWPPHDPLHFDLCLPDSEGLDSIMKAGRSHADGRGDQQDCASGNDDPSSASLLAIGLAHAHHSAARPPAATVMRNRRCRSRGGAIVSWHDAYSTQATRTHRGAGCRTACRPRVQAGQRRRSAVRSSGTASKGMPRCPKRVRVGRPRIRV